MKETGKIQKEILEKKLLQVQHSLSDLQKKKENLKKEEEKLLLSKEKIERTLSTFGKSVKREDTPQREISPRKTLFPRIGEESQPLTEEEKRLIPPSILNDPSISIREKRDYIRR